MVSYLNSSLQFPPQLDDFISDRLNGIYLPDYETAYRNKCADMERQKINLGTYFPRSFIETYVIFKDLINNEHINNVFEKTDFFILDIGGGLGGNLCGLLWFMRDNVKDFKNKKIHILSLDCNDIALDIQKQIINEFFMDNTEFYSENIDMSCNNFGEMIQSVTENDDFFSNNNKNKFDVIMTFKFVNELYRDFQDYTENMGMYNKITTVVTNYLDENGLFILADTTDQNNVGIYFPKIMSGEISQYLRNNSGKLRPIAPLSCAFWHMNCGESWRCYNLKSFKIRTSNQNYTSKLSYKIFAHSDTAEKILKLMEKQDCYHIGYRHSCEKGSFKYENPSYHQYKDAFSYTDNVKKDDLE